MITSFNPGAGLKPLAAALLCAGLFNATPAGAASIVVDSLADGSLATLNLNGTCDLREAIANAVSDDQSGGTDCPAGDGDDTLDLTGLSGVLALDPGENNLDISSPIGSLTLSGPGPDVLSLSGGDQVRVFRMAFATVTLSGLTVTEGFNTNYGGGIMVDGGSLTLNDVAITNNHVENYGFGADGGGLALFDTNLSMSDSTISGNSADFSGGGLFFETYQGGVTLEIQRSRISGNTAANHGGGLYLHGLDTSSPSLIQSCVIDGNSATNGFGGGIYLRGVLSQEFNIRACTLSGNTARYGGGLYLGSTDTSLTGAPAVWLENATLSGNTATEGPGGAVATTMNLQVVNSTLSGNRAAQADVGGIYAYYGDVTLHNSILAGNTSDASPPGVDLQVVNGTLTAQSSLVENTAHLLGAGNLVNMDPLLGGLADNGGPSVGATGSTHYLATHLPQPGSPVRDAGNDALVPTYDGNDQRGAGYSRIRGTAVDLGAVETVPAARPAGPAQPVPGLAGWSLPALAGLLAWLGWGGGTRRSAGVQAGKRRSRRTAS